MRSLNRLEEALSAYQDTIAAFPNDRVAKNGVACLLIEMNQLEKVQDYLPESTDLISEQDWRDCHVLSMLAMRQGDFEKAERMMRKGVNAPFVKDQRIFKNSLALLLMRTNRAKEAVQQVILQLSEVAAHPEQAVLYCHALSENEQIAEAEKFLQAIPEKSSAVIVDFCGLLKQRYLSEFALSEFAKNNLNQEITNQEFSLILRAA